MFRSVFYGKNKNKRRTWRKRTMIIPCKTCGKPALAKNKFYVLCSDCIQDYLNNLESMAKENSKKKESFEVRKSQYSKLYKKIERTKEKLCDIPRKLATERPTDRDCLKCDRGFIAAGKFNRICNRCKDSNMEIEEFYL